MKWILAGALLMAAPIVAGAECGWVLWEEIRIGTWKEPIPTSSFTLQSAHPTFQGCDARAQELALQAQKSGTSLLLFHVAGEVIEAREGFYKVTFETELPKPDDSDFVKDFARHGSRAFECFPDKINPAVEYKRERDNDKRKHKKDSMKK